MSSNNIPGKLRFSPATVFGDTAANDTVLEEGTLSIDLTRDVINIHDGVTKGGLKQVQTAPVGQPVLTYDPTSINTPLPIFGTYPGSSSNPFLTIEARNEWATENITMLLTQVGKYTAWGPGNVEYRFVGPGAGDWVLVDLPARNGRIVHILGDSTSTAENGLQWAELLCLLSKGRFVRGINAATSSAKIEDVAVSQLTNKLLGIPCDEIWIQIGRNNSYETISVVMGRMSLLIAAVKTVYPLATIRIFSILTSSNSTEGTRFTYAYNAALQDFARSNRCEYHGGWSGVAASDGSLSATYSVDTVHVGLAGNLLAAQARLIDIFGAAPSDPSPAIIAGVLSWDTSLMNLDSDANGVSDTWNNYAIPNGGTSQASLVACSAPYVGKWQRRTLAAYSGTVHDSRTGILIDPTKDYELSIALDIDYPANAGVRGWVKFSSSATTSVVEIGSLTLFNWNGAGKATINVDGFMRFLIPKEIIPANTLSIAVQLHNVGVGAFTCESNWGMLSLREISGWR